MANSVLNLLIGGGIDWLYGLMSPDVDSGDFIIHKGGSEAGVYFVWEGEVCLRFW